MLRALLLLLLAAPLAAQGPLDSAAAAIAAGQPWHATQILAPVLATPNRPPEAVILAAQAAAGWEGWPTVRRLLEGQPWLDSRFDGLGHRLLAEAALGEGRNAQALVEALTAAHGNGGARDSTEQGHRLVLLAIAYDRLDQLDSAAISYLRAGGYLPRISEWLALRAAGVTRDSAARTVLLAGVRLPAAAARIGWTEAYARDRSGDLAGAAARYDALGASAKALYARWRAADSEPDRRSVADGLAKIFRAPASTAEAREALDLADSIEPPFTASQQLDRARRAAAVSRAQDAVDAYATAAKSAPLDAQDRFRYATALGDVRRWDDAAAEFRAIRDPALAGHAAYFAARAQLRGGNEPRAITALLNVTRRYPSDTVAAGTALYLLGDLAIDLGQPDTARIRFRTLVRRYPSSSFRPHAELLAALITFAAGNPATAARELAAGLARGVGSEADAFRYWLARARQASGDSAQAAPLFRTLVARGPQSYYAVRSAARLDTVPWRDSASFAPAVPSTLATVFARAALLESMGLDFEAGLERDQIAADARGVAALREAAIGFAASGMPNRGAQLAQRALSAGGDRDSDLWRLLYPLPFGDVLRATAARNQVDPLLVAAVIRQESAFDPHATSRADARGLMQVLPATGKDGARTLGLPDFDPALLWVPDVNLAIGIRHFAAALARYPEVERALAAYNAGSSAVDRWSTSPLTGKTRRTSAVRQPLDDAELFVERIPYEETRNYVRAIVRNREVYAMLYDER